MNLRTIAISICLIYMGLLPACSAGQLPPVIPPAEPSANIGEVFVLGPGEALLIEDGLMLVGVDQVLEDSRCPANAMCVRAGQVKVQVTVDQKSYVLTLGELAQSDRILVGLENGLTLRLVDVQPYPEMETGTPTYEVSLIVEGYMRD